MKLTFSKSRGILSVVGIFLVGVIAASCVSQENHVGQTAGVDNTKMGLYRALAQLTYQEFKQGNCFLAAEHAHILDVAWDQGQEGDNSLMKTNKDLYEQIDHAMDVFIHPILMCAYKMPEAASVESAYKDYQEKLNLADYGTKTPPALPQAIHLSSDILKTFVGKYQATPSPDPSARRRISTMEITANREGLLSNRGDGNIHQLLPLSSVEFFSQENPAIHITFTKDEQGQIIGFTMAGRGEPKKFTKLP